MSTGRARPGRRLLLAGVLAVLLVAMVLDTRFMTPDELAAAQPEQFDPEATAVELFDRVDADLTADAPDLADVVTGVQEDLPGAAEEFGAAQPDQTTFLFPVSGQGTVTEATETALVLRVEGAPSQTPVSVVLGTAITGTVLRDALGFGFADAPTQSAYQQVGDALKVLMQEQVTAGLGGEPPAAGDVVRFAGVVSVTDTGGDAPPERPVAVQPVSLEGGAR